MAERRRLDRFLSNQDSVGLMDYEDDGEPKTLGDLSKTRSRLEREEEEENEEALLQAEKEKEQEENMKNMFIEVRSHSFRKY